MLNNMVLNQQVFIFSPYIVHLIPMLNIKVGIVKAKIVLTLLRRIVILLKIRKTKKQNVLRKIIIYLLIAKKGKVFQRSKVCLLITVIKGEHKFPTINRRLLLESMIKKKMQLLHMTITG